MGSLSIRTSDRTPGASPEGETGHRRTPRGPLDEKPFEKGRGPKGSCTLHQDLPRKGTRISSPLTLRGLAALRGCGFFVWSPWSFGAQSSIHTLFFGMWHDVALGQKAGGLWLTTEHEQNRLPARQPDFGAPGPDENPRARPR